MPAEPHDTGDTGWDSSAGFTQEPHESDLVTHRAPLYAEEPGIKPGKPSPVTLAPCTTCGVPVITRITDHGKLINVETQTITYVLLWRSGERHPRLKPGRGYPAHQCRPCKEEHRKEHTMSDAPATVLDVQRIHAEAATIEAAIEAAHQGTPRCCCACPTCQLAPRFMARMMPLLAQQCTDTQRMATDTDRKITDTLRQVEEVNHRTAEHAALLADYEALHADYTALHAAYVMAREALSSARGQGPELH